MNVFIVHAHPEPKSFNAAMCNIAADEFRSQGHEVQISDLYAMHFNPVASGADFLSRKDRDYLVYALEQRHAYESDSLSADLRAEIAKLLWCDLLIFNFPVYWFSTPAILKGWIDRVMVSGLTYGGKRFYDRGGLVGKRAMLSITLGGRPHMFGPQGVHGPLEDMLKPLLQGTLAYTGLTVLPTFVGYHVPYVSAEERGAIMVDYRRHLRSLDALVPLRFPSLDAFDDRLYPRSAVNE